MLSRMRKLASIVILPAVLFIAACDDIADPEPEPDVATMRLTIGATNPQIVTVNAATGDVTGGPISIRVNTPTALSVEWLNAAGTPDPVASSGEFELRIDPLTPAAITYTRIGDRNGTLNATATTTTGSGTFQLFHKTAGHEDLERIVPIVVTQ